MNLGNIAQGVANATRKAIRNPMWGNWIHEGSHTPATARGVGKRGRRGRRGKNY